MSSQSTTAKFLAVSILAFGLTSANAQGFFKKPAPPAPPAATSAPVTPASVAASTPAPVAVAAPAPVATTQAVTASAPSPKKDATEPVQAAKPVPVPAVKAKVTPAPVLKPITENSTVNSTANTSTITSKIIEKSLTPTPAQAAAATVQTRQVIASDASIRQLGDIENTMQGALRALRSGSQN